MNNTEIQKDELLATPAKKRGRPAGSVSSSKKATPAVKKSGTATPKVVTATKKSVPAATKTAVSATKKSTATKQPKATSRAVGAKVPTEQKMTETTTPVPTVAMPDKNARVGDTATNVLTLDSVSNTSTKECASMDQPENLPNDQKKNNCKKRIAVIIAAVLIGLGLIGGGVALIARSTSQAGANASSSAEIRRKNALELVKSYLERGEYDRALNILDNLILENGNDDEISELMDRILNLKRDAASGSGNSDALEAILRELSAAIEGSNRSDAETARLLRELELQKNRKELRSETDVTQSSDGSRNTDIAPSNAITSDDTKSVSDEKRQSEEAARAAEEATRNAEQEAQKAEEAAAEQRRKEEEELLARNKAMKELLDKINDQIALGKKGLDDDNLIVAAEHFAEAEQLCPTNEKKLSGSKLTEISDAYYNVFKTTKNKDSQNESLKNAMQYASKATARDPSSGAPHFTLGRIYSDLKQWDSAVTELKDAARLDPNNYQYAYELGKAYYLARKYSEARQAFETSVSLNASFAPAQYNLGLTLKNLGRTQDAQRAFEKTIKIKPDHARAYMEIARILDKKNDTAGAIKNYSTCLRYMPNNIAALCELGTVYSRTGNDAKAEQYFSQALALNADDARTNYNMATVQLNQKKYSEALIYAKKAVDSAPATALYQYNYGVAAESVGKTDDAINAYQAAIAVDAKYVNPLVNLARIYLDGDMIDKALDYLLKGFALEPSSFEVNNNLGNAYTKKELFDRAVDHYARAVKADPRDTVVRMNLARSYVSAGDLNNARVAYSELIKLDAKIWDAYYELGKVCVSLNDKPAASQWLSSLLQKNPSYEKAAEVKMLQTSLQ